MKPTEKVYWIKVAFAIVAGAVCYVAQAALDLDGSLIFMLGAIIYLTFSDVLSGFMKLEKSHGLKVGIGAYVFTWLVVWTLLYTVSKTMA